MRSTRALFWGWPGTNAPAVHVGPPGWILLSDLARLEYFDWESAAPRAPEDDEALEAWLRLYPGLLDDGER